MAKKQRHDDDGARLDPAKDSVTIFSCCIVRKTMRPKIY
jgi:hypothetical protein